MEKRSFHGENSLTSVVLADTVTGEEREEEFDGVFVFIGLTPNSELAGALQKDEAGFLVTDVGMQTSQPGVFAAGDVRVGSTKQAASAAGEGAAAALGIRRYVEGMWSHIRTPMFATLYRLTIGELPDFPELPVVAAPRS